VPLVEQELLLTLPEHLSSPPLFSGIHVGQSLVFCPKEKVNMLKSLQRENLRMAKELKERKMNQMKKRKVKV
jgi:hypothetical protein